MGWKSETLKFNFLEIYLKYLNEIETFNSYLKAAYNMHFFLNRFFFQLQIVKNAKCIF